MGSQVSIPYSSGHLFRWEDRCPLCGGQRFSRLNPLFIRSSIPFRAEIMLLEDLPPKSQSLIHQVIYSVKKA